MHVCWQLSGKIPYSDLSGLAGDLCDLADDLCDLDGDIFDLDGDLCDLFMQNSAEEAPIAMLSTLKTAMIANEIHTCRVVLKYRSVIDSRQVDAPLDMTLSIVASIRQPYRCDRIEKI